MYTNNILTSLWLKSFPCLVFIQKYFSFNTNTMQSITKTEYTNGAYNISALSFLLIIKINGKIDKNRKDNSCGQIIFNLDRITH
jgi:hypothetical protein